MVEKQHDVDYTDPEESKTTKVFYFTILNRFNQTDLPEVQKVTGEEAEECIFKMRSKLYRFRDQQWKERGTGNCKLMRNRETKKIRFVMR